MRERDAHGRKKDGRRRKKPTEKTTLLQSGFEPLDSEGSHCLATAPRPTIGELKLTFFSNETIQKTFFFVKIFVNLSFKCFSFIVSRYVRKGTIRRKRGSGL